MSAGFIERTFQLTSGVGGWRERDLWARGLATWADFEAAAKSGVVMSAKLDGPLLQKIAEARVALEARDLAALAKLVPIREHWRLYPAFVDQAAFFDIEADNENIPTVVGVMDTAGLASFRRHRTMHEVPARLAKSPIWVTFNGAVFDVPVLEQFFEGHFPKPAVHLDLRFLVRRTHLKGGLKGIEEALHLHRPPHLKGLKGFDAIRLWREFTFNGRLDALRILIEYNLLDAINLRSVLEWTMWRIAELSAWDIEKTPIFERGDVQYDLSRLVLAEDGL